MGDRIASRQLLKLKADTLTESQVSEVLDYISIMESLSEESKRSDLFDDELVNVLADALENRRARVVTEWERTRRKADNRAAAFLLSKKPM
jgi:hypothetical protein